MDFYHRMIRFLFPLGFFFLLAGLTGCSQNANDVSSTLKSAFWGMDPTNISPEQIQKLPYASLSAKLGDNPTALLILTWIENTPNAPILKWLSTNKELIATQHGRIIKTANLRQGNVLSLHASRADPLQLGLQKNTTPREWHYYISWQPGYHWNYQATSVFYVGNKEKKQRLDGKTQQLLHVTEVVTIPVIKQNYTNDYWLDPITGNVIISEQYLYPGSQKMTLSIAKPYNAGGQ